MARHEGSAHGPLHDVAPATEQWSRSWVYTMMAHVLASGGHVLSEHDQG